MESKALSLTLNGIMNGLLQLILFSIIPFIWWKYGNKKGKYDEKFLTWIGLKKPKFIKNKKTYLYLILIIISWYICYTFDIGSLVNISEKDGSDAVASSVFKGMGFSAVIPVLIQSMFQQGFTEELLFRGFITKRLINKFGFECGNLIQASLFGMMHVVLFLLAGIKIGLLELFLIFVITGIPGLLLGCLNERIFNGSIVPSILVHGFGNFYSAMLVALSLT